MTLSHLYVLEQHRRHGVGTALMKAAIAYAGDNQIELVVSRKNTAARRFFRTLGFRLDDSVSLRLKPCQKLH